MLSAFFAFLTFFLIAGCQAQLPCRAPCEAMRAVANYDPTKMLGRWYRFSSYPEFPFGRCSQHIYTAGNDGITTLVVKTMPMKPSEPPIPDKVYKLKYIGKANYHVLSPMDDVYFNKTIMMWNTDYTSYSIKGVCQTYHHASDIWAWSLTRDPNPSPSVIAEIRKLIKDDGLDNSFFRRDNHTNCPTNV